MENRRRLETGIRGSPRGRITLYGVGDRRSMLRSQRENQVATWLCRQRSPPFEGPLPARGQGGASDRTPQWVWLRSVLPPSESGLAGRARGSFSASNAIESGQRRSRMEIQRSDVTNPTKRLKLARIFADFCLLGYNLTRVDRHSLAGRWEIS